MKREALDHTKTKRLCRRLDIPLYQAVGILETLWHLTAKQTPRGDIGRISNDEIALGLDYRGDEDVLVRELVMSGWLDPDPKFRLLVHDWYEHAPDATQVKLARAREFFATGQPPKTQRLGARERTEADSFYAAVRTDIDFVRTNDDSVRTDPPIRAHKCAQNPDSRTPPPPPPPPPPKRNTLSPGLGDRNGSGKPHGPLTLPTVAGEIHARHPAARRDCSTATVEKKLAAILKHKHIPVAGSDEYLAQVNLNHEGACRSPDWRKEDGQFAKSLENWLAPTKERYDVKTESKSSRPPEHAII